MSYTPVPTASKSQINKAAKILNDINIDFETRVDAWELVNSWRACHAYPINTFQALLRKRVKGYEAPLVAQRLKRLPTILHKLRRFKNMKFTTMQDIGGVRAVLKSLTNVRDLQNKYLTSKSFKHELKDIDDYIKKPKEDGYRSVHLIYKYKNAQAPTYNGLYVELQIRTKLQHTWATAVETMGTFLGEELKTGGGNPKWRSFFTAVSSAFAHIEGTSPVPGLDHLSKEETYVLIKTTEARLRVLEKLESLSDVAIKIDRKEKKGYYHLIILDSEKKQTEIKSYARHQLKDALNAYSNYEALATKETSKKIDLVFVSAGSIEQLKRSYPNYFLDVKDFIKIVREIVGK